MVVVYHKCVLSFRGLDSSGLRQNEIRVEDEYLNFHFFLLLNM